LLAIGEYEPPAIVGLCEVENRYVLNKLIFQTPIKKFKYKMIHNDSPDLRGVDVALLYRPEKFFLLSWKCIRVSFPFDPSAQTREILMVKGRVFESDTIILFVNHWPSRRGGHLESQPRRNIVAGLLRSAIDSVIRTDSQPNIIIMGDFNDEPDKISLSQVLGARPHTGDSNTMSLSILCIQRKTGGMKGQSSTRDNGRSLISSLYQGTLSGQLEEPSSCMLKPTFSRTIFSWKKMTAILAKN
jgi:hypothetical protein